MRRVSFLQACAVSAPANASIPSEPHGHGMCKLSVLQCLQFSLFHDRSTSSQGSRPAGSQDFLEVLRQTLSVHTPQIKTPSHVRFANTHRFCKMSEVLTHLFTTDWQILGLIGANSHTMSFSKKYALNDFISAHVRFQECVLIIHICRNKRRTERVVVVK